MSENIQKISLALVDDPTTPMRSDIDMEVVRELAASIQELGLLQAITVRPRGERFEIVAGHRRFKAHLLLGKPTIDCVVRELDDEKAFEVMAAENLERQDVDPVDEALFVGRLMNVPDATLEGVAKRLNRSIGWIADRLDILEYPEYMIIAVKQGIIKLGVAKYLARITDDTYRKMYVEGAIKNGMSVLQAEYAFNQFKAGLFPSLDDINAAGEALHTGELPKTRALCAKCAQVAIEPNLRMVWIHVSCPVDSVPVPEI